MAPYDSTRQGTKRISVDTPTIVRVCCGRVRAGKSVRGYVGPQDRVSRENRQVRATERPDPDLIGSYTFGWARLSWFYMRPSGPWWLLCNAGGLLETKG